jgi:WD40 repeat protein
MKVLRVRGRWRKVNVLGFAPAGELLASASDHGVLLWEWPAERVRASYKVWYGMALTFSSDARMLAVGLGHSRAYELGLGYASGVLLDTAAGSVLRALDPPQNVHSLALRPDGTFVSAGYTLQQGPSVVRGSLATGAREEVLGLLPRAGIRLLTADGSRLAATSSAKSLEVWDLAPLGHRCSCQQDNQVSCLAFSADGRLLATGDGWSALLWSAAEGRRLAQLKGGHKNRVEGLAFAPDGRTLATVGLDGIVAFWDISTGKQRRAYDWGVGKLRAVAFAPDGMTAAAGGDGGQIVIWDVDDG